MVTVNITDGEYTSKELYEAVKHDYINSSETVRQLQIKYRLSPHRWDKIVREIKKETGLTRKANGRKKGVIIHEI